MAATKKLSFNPETVMQIDPWLEPFLPALSGRYSKFLEAKDALESSEGNYDAFSQGFKKFGLNVKPDGSLVYQEWAPNATEAALIGDFSKLPSSIYQDQYSSRRVCHR
jgi:1,4-alpha-glucan branching enzyme